MMVKQVPPPSPKFFAANTNALPAPAFDAQHVRAFAGLLPGIDIPRLPLMLLGDIKFRGP
jgi:hypothetical protein